MYSRPTHTRWGRIDTAPTRTKSDLLKNGVVRQAAQRQVSALWLPTNHHTRPSTCLSTFLSTCLNRCLNSCLNTCLNTCLNSCLNSCLNTFLNTSLTAKISNQPSLHCEAGMSSISASPTACQLRGYGRAGTKNDRLGEAVVLSTGTPTPAQYTCHRRRRAALNLHAHYACDLQLAQLVARRCQPLYQPRAAPVARVRRSAELFLLPPFFLHGARQRRAPWRGIAQGGTAAPAELLALFRVFFGFLF